MKMTLMERLQEDRIAKPTAKGGGWRLYLTPFIEP